jgi:hypothetical protein
MKEAISDGVSTRKGTAGPSRSTSPRLGPVLEADVMSLTPG